MFFSERKDMAELFAKWCEEKGLAPVHETMIAWLGMNGCLDERKCRELLTANGKKPFPILRRGKK